ncbi:hypothetical protein ACH5RR_019389 [Cinchona calisaya]|uniref:Myb/SANT-like DNA-binding domain-containing protein n=1 Tax=Cinchona calisaya TaxID=153742 RepID=A0ABD2ZP73_9GENT
MQTLQQIHTPHRRPHAGGREDCWSEGATESLIEAWGDRYLHLNRGNLRQKDWIEVADAVNSRQNGVKPRRTDVQCKNRVDTLKKKYKLEKGKPSPSKWPFYSRLNFLIGGNSSISTSSLTPLNKKSGVTKFTEATLNPILNPNLNGGLDVGGSDESCDGDDDGDGNKVGLRRRHKNVELLEEDTTSVAACNELARAILKFGEIYERVESAKQLQMMELEKQRLEFIKDLEFQRMNLFMEAQLQREKSKRPSKNASGSGFLVLWKLTVQLQFSVSTYAVKWHLLDFHNEVQRKEDVVRYHQISR